MQGQTVDKFPLKTFVSNASRRKQSVGSKNRAESESKIKLKVQHSFLYIVLRVPQILTTKLQKLYLFACTILCGSNSSYTVS